MYSAVSYSITPPLGVMSSYHSPLKSSPFPLALRPLAPTFQKFCVPTIRCDYRLLHQDWLPTYLHWISGKASRRCLISRPINSRVNSLCLCSTGPRQIHRVSVRCYIRSCTLEAKSLDLAGWQEVWNGIGSGG
ncbi:hypothetical protein TREMEDRAFT_36453 [Tremella mesenterica DSM 1558]|uniref:uncharacterized protein n=1 Tax=Tremella mesenterica (strain ATCC 24925 / CBS 8224 / DSM 1558 / NBRC 9311 / NRRL Y-6157 / RJB 2259-6 / UBC 559-6) TaxID=578456 RepID=UPI0003F493A3|nr:uncharacterized protein TREMEDRAFT_36453 [Tremella mesenterica DSM 1558]EIW72119.1 hypothetical protein TREMEDRAFT_36453 [Tremella mesenterica DSM 1558]